jgi:hypothetical protein
VRFALPMSWNNSLPATPLKAPVPPMIGSLLSGPPKTPLALILPAGKVKTTLHRMRPRVAVRWQTPLLWPTTRWWRLSSSRKMSWPWETCWATVTPVTLNSSAVNALSGPCGARYCADDVAEEHRDRPPLQRSL